MKYEKKLILLIGILTAICYHGCDATSDMSRSGIAEKSENSIAMNVIDNADGAAEDAAFDDAGDLPDADYAGFGGDDMFSYDGESPEAEIAPADMEPELNAEAPKSDMLADEIIPDENGEAFQVTSEFDSQESKIGMLTAGQWNDNNNWGFFQNLVNTGLVQFPSFGIDPTRRIAVTVKNSDGELLPNAEVMLMQEDNAIWCSKTNKNGVAYLFANAEQSGNKIIVQQDNISQEIALDFENITTTSDNSQDEILSYNSEYDVILDTEPKLYANTEIMFIVDTTGSMGDEMLFLQSDFSAIAEEVGDENTRYSVNFYKDDGDSYVTKCFDFTSDTQEIKNLLCAESASGGGDEPEAVAEILTETICNSIWQEDSVKIAFLIYDAPPHEFSTDILQLQQAIAEASKKGIHLVPVVSSNSSRETELFGRAIAICTNSDYVFLTDDSGIGGSHLEPIIGDYQVESLHDIIVRIIQEYKQ